MSRPISHENFLSCLFIGDFSIKLLPWAKGFKASNMELISKILLKLEIKRIFQLLNGLESTRKSYFCSWCCDSDMYCQTSVLHRLAKRA